MLFNSIEFALFLPIVFIIHWYYSRGNRNRQNLTIVAASYFFYGWWDWRFLFLILFSTVVDFLVGLRLEKEKVIFRRKALLILSITVNLGLLGFFKYYNFFIDSMVAGFTFFGSSFSSARLDIILPVGISFYTFQTLSYTIDVYKGKLDPTRDFLSFCSFVSFFPQLVAGPIERASNLLPQFNEPRRFNYEVAIDGMRQILWGLFKKMVIADNCAVYVNMIFNNSDDYNGSTLFIGALLFTFQIYGDFSGYSDIAIGTARLFGVRLMQNFRFPYFSRDIAEFWRRWHISLSTWFKDYLYIPLGGSRGGRLMRIRNTFIIFVVSGLWHGANWTFIFWGFLNALYFVPLLLREKNRQHLNEVAANRHLPNFIEFFNISKTFLITVFAWIFFRSRDMTQAVDIVQSILSISFFEIPEIFPTTVFALVFIFLVFEWQGRKNQYAIEKMGLTWILPFRMGLYYGLVFLIIWFGGNEQEFIYFQF